MLKLHASQFMCMQAVNDLKTHAETEKSKKANNDCLVVCTTKQWNDLPNGATISTSFKMFFTIKLIYF